MEFNGTVTSRSWGRTKPGIAPSETLIQSLNPRRVAIILENTGWKHLAEGTLNFRVPRETHSILWSKPFLFEEWGKDVPYPAPWKDIPINRISYRYYSATATLESKTENVLIRLAQAPADPTVIDLISQLKLRVQLSPFDTHLVPDETILDIDLIE